jgi:hypothetical protein
MNACTRISWSLLLYLPGLAALGQEKTATVYLIWKGKAAATESLPHSIATIMIK